MEIEMDTDTQSSTYTDRLITKRAKWWKHLIDVQVPYRWNLKRINPGFFLDIGCGTGRHLLNLDGNGVGIDHNAHSTQYARRIGLRAYTPDEFKTTEYNQPSRFDSLLFSHVAEHMTSEQFRGILLEYLPYLKAGGKVIIITPQEAGYQSDPTHVEFKDFQAVLRIAEQTGLKLLRQYSFPFPRPVGKVFKHNEFISVFLF